MLSKLSSVKNSGNIVKCSVFWGNSRFFFAKVNEKTSQTTQEQKFSAHNFKFAFDNEGKTPIYWYKSGETELRWLIRGLVLFTMLNTFLAVAEYVKPLFGGWNGFSFTLTSLLGIGSLIFLNIISKRVIKKIKLFRTGDFVEIEFFNAFWLPHSKTFHISEFSNLEPSYFSYGRTEITSMGNAWINLEKNYYEGLKDYEKVLEDVLNGTVMNLNKLEQKAKKYDKYK